MIALIDGDIITYAAGFAANRALYTTQDGKIFDYKKEAVEHCNNKDLDIKSIQKDYSDAPLSNALHLTKLMLHGILDYVGADSYEIFLSGSSNYRKYIGPTYKQNRDTAHKPVHYTGIREYIINNWDGTLTEGIEADDALGIAQCYIFKYESIICSIDKDLLMIPGKHFNINKQITSWITKGEADNNFYLQLLTGDRTDNIPSSNAIGKTVVTAIYDKFRYLTNPVDKYNIVKQYFNSEEELITNARLLWIQRKPLDMWTIPT